MTISPQTVRKHRKTRNIQTETDTKRYILVQLPHGKTYFKDGCVLVHIIRVFDSLFRQGESMTLENVVKTTIIFIKGLLCFISSFQRADLTVTDRLHC